MATKTAAASSARNVASEIAYLARALKAPTLGGAVDRLAKGPGPRTGPTRSSWRRACNAKSPPARHMAGRARIRAARFPARKSLEEFDFDHQRSLKRDTITHLGTLDFITAKENVVFLGPPGTGKTHCPSVWRSAPAKPATASPSPPPPNGSPDWPRPTTAADCRTN